MDLRRISASTGALLASLAVGPSGQASNVCNETVPSTHIIDGIPSYSQCTDSTNSPIYSNNGVDTATASGGTGWVRTQSSGGYQCTELAHRYLYFKWSVQSVPNGNAGTWCDGTIPSGLVKTTTPIHGDLVVFAPGICGADSTTGHVAVVDVVGTDSSVTFVEQNLANRRKCSLANTTCFLHATANTGEAVDGGIPADAAPDASIGDVAMQADGSGRRSDAFLFPDRPELGAGGATGTGGAGGVASSGGAGGTAAGTTTAGGRTGAGGSGGSGGASGSGDAGGSGGALSVSTPTGAGGSTPAATAAPASPSGGCTCRLAGGGNRGNDCDTRLALLLIGLALGSRRLVRGRRNGKRKPD